MSHPGVNFLLVSFANWFLDDLFQTAHNTNGAFQMPGEKLVQVMSSTLCMVGKQWLYVCVLATSTQQLFAKALSKTLCKGSFRKSFVKPLSIILLFSYEEYSIYT